MTLVVDPGVHYLGCLAGKIDLILPVVSLENRDLGSGPRFMVVDPGVHYQGPLPFSNFDGPGVILMKQLG